MIGQSPSEELSCWPCSYWSILSRSLLVRALWQTALKEGEAMRLKSVLDGERRLELEAEIRGLKAAVVDAQTNAEQLEEMSRSVVSQQLL